jgi:predicted RNase H-like nuclease (RuvC/YqgF family)
MECKYCGMRHRHLTCVGALKDRIAELERENKEYSQCVARDANSIGRLEQEVERLRHHVDTVEKYAEQMESEALRLRSALEQLESPQPWQDRLDLIHIAEQALKGGDSIGPKGR